MENMNMIFCGLGGQGILFMTKIFARAALDKGLETLGAETHGMAQRGGIRGIPSQTGPHGKQPGEKPNSPVSPRPGRK